MNYTGQERGDKLEPLPLRIPCYSNPLTEPSWPSWSNHGWTACIHLGGSESQPYRSALPQSHSNPLAELGLLESPNPSRCQGCLSQQSGIPGSHKGSRANAGGPGLPAMLTRAETAKNQKAAGGTLLGLVEEGGACCKGLLSKQAGGRGWQSLGTPGRR